MVAAERRAPGQHTTNACIAAAPNDGYLALAGAAIAAAIHDCKAGESEACIWIVAGQGREWLSLLTPGGADPAALNAKLRALAPEVVQLSMFAWLGDVA